MTACGGGNGSWIFAFLIIALIFGGNGWGNGAQATVFNLDTRHKYLCRVVTSATGGSFRMLGNSCCSHSDALRSINGTAVTV